MKYRKKPIVIEAWQNKGDGESIPEWVDARCTRDRDGARGGLVLVIQTLEGTMRADPMDWIIQGVKGEVYPCKPDIFAATYEPVS